MRLIAILAVGALLAGGAVNGFACNGGGGGMTGGTTGLASIIYSDDQYRNDANNHPSSICTPATSNTSSCNHTTIATQLSGSGIN